MDSHDLTPEQAAKLWERLGPHLRYLNRLRRRMEERGFTPNDELRRKRARQSAAVVVVSKSIRQPKQGNQNRNHWRTKIGTSKQRHQAARPRASCAESLEDLVTW
jgi:hypothetical protein